MSQITQRLAELGLVLPDLKGPSGNYVPFRRSGGLIFLSGQVPRVNGKDAFQGVIGADMTLAQGQAAARTAAINLVAQLSRALGGKLDQVEACLQLRGFVRAVAGFTEHPAVIDGASDLLVDIFGERGMHARTAIGAGSLPRGFSVELEAIFQVES